MSFPDLVETVSEFGMPQYIYSLAKIHFSGSVSVCKNILLGSPLSKNKPSLFLTREMFVSSLCSKTASFVQKTNENKFFVLRKTAEGVVGFVVDTDNINEKAFVWKNGFSSWRAFWGKNENIFLQTAASQLENGYFYKLNETGVLTKLFGPEQGLLVLHNELTNISLVRNKLGLFLDKGEPRRIFLQTDTLPEKCIFAKEHIYCGIPNSLTVSTRSGNDTLVPDSWYRGDVIYNDDFYKINTETTVVNKIDLNLDDKERSQIDLINPKLSEDEKFLFFQNKIDYSLWVLEL